MPRDREPPHRVHHSPAAADRRRSRPTLSVSRAAVRAVRLHLLAIHHPQRAALALVEGGTGRGFRLLVCPRPRSSPRLGHLRQRSRSKHSLDRGAAHRARGEPSRLLIGRPRSNVQPEHDRARRGARAGDLLAHRRGSAHASGGRGRSPGMTVFRSVARNIAILAASRVVTWVAAFAFAIAQARYLGPGRFGELSVALTYAALLAVVMDFGLGTQLSRIVAQRSRGH